MWQFYSLFPQLTFRMFIWKSQCRQVIIRIVSRGKVAYNHTLLAEREVCSVYHSGPNTITGVLSALEDVPISGPISSNEQHFIYLS